MKKIALFAIIFVTLQLSQSCTHKPEDDIPQIGDSLTTTVPMGDGPNVAPPANRQPDPTRENYVLPVDTSYIKGEGVNTLIHVMGPLGDGCQKFEYVDSIRDGAALKLTFYASKPKDPNTVCTQQMQYYEQQIRVDPTEYKSYRVIQPNGSGRDFPIPQ